MARHKFEIGGNPIITPSLSSKSDWINHGAKCFFVVAESPTDEWPEGFIGITWLPGEVIPIAAGEQLLIKSSQTSQIEGYEVSNA